MARPTKMTPETINKLELAFMRGLNDTQACLYAGISDVTLDKYEAKNPEFVSKKKSLKQNVKMQAKVLLAESIEAGDKYDAKWWLERRDPDFKPKKETDINLNPHEDFIKMMIEKGKKD
jgi:hypothetical protein